MTNGKQIISRGIAILMLCGIVMLVGYVLYISYKDFDKPVPEVVKTDSIGRLFEINGYKYYIRNNVLYDENDNMIADLPMKYYLRNNVFYDENDYMIIDLSIDINNISSNNVQNSSFLKDVLIEGLGGEKENFDDYSIFGYGKKDAQRLYIQSVINSMSSGKTIEVSRWVTSGDWSQDDENMTITIP